MGFRYIDDEIIERKLEADPELKTVEDVDRALQSCHRRLDSWSGETTWGAAIAIDSASRDIWYLKEVREYLVRNPPRRW